MYVCVYYMKLRSGCYGFTQVVEELSRVITGVSQSLVTRSFHGHVAYVRKPASPVVFSLKVFGSSPSRGHCVQA